MKASVTHYFSDETSEFLASEYLIDGEKVSLEDYAEFIREYMGDDIDNEVGQNDCVCGQNDNCEDCNCDDCPGCANTECCEENREYDCDNVDSEEELKDWQKQIIDIVEDFADRIENKELCRCGCTLRNMLVDMFYQARQIGFEDGLECGVNGVKEKTVNLHIDNLVLSNVTDSSDKLREALLKLPMLEMKYCK